MKSIKLISIELRNFKKFPHLKAEFNGENAVISGMNASGKSTIADAYFWLLTDKNFAGDAKFAVTPIDVVTGYELRDCFTSVEAVFEINGLPVTLKKEQMENISKKDRELLKPESIAPKTIQYYIDTTPTATSTAFKWFISEKFGNDETIRFLTNLNYFTSQKPEKQRELLLKIDDNASVTLSEDYDKVKHLIANVPAEAVLKALKSQLKASSERLEVIPKLKDENSRYLPNITANYSEQCYSEQLEQANNEKTLIEKQIKEVENSDEVLALKRKISTFVFVDFEEELALLEKTHDKADRDSDMYFTKLDLCKKALETIKKEEILESCVTCGREFDKTSLMKATANKQERIKEMLKNIEDCDRQYNQAEKRAAEINKEIEILRKSVKEIQNARQAEYENLHQKLKDLISSKTAELNQKLHDLNSKIFDLNGFVEKQQRINELITEQRTLTNKNATTLNEIDLLDTFITKRNRSLQAKINGYFKGVEFVLFEMQKNGEYAQTCEATISKIRFSDANTAAKINAQLEIIDVFSKRFGVRLPLFVDNTESINKLYQPDDTQMIKLQVTHGELKISKEK